MKKEKVEREGEERKREEGEGRREERTGGLEDVLFIYYIPDTFTV